MRDREEIVVGGLILLMLLTWLGFLVHVSPTFAGSALGGVLAITGTALMLVPALYSLIKRVAWLRRRVRMRTLLTWHIYAGVLGPIIALIHTGHKFESPLGVTLTALMLLVVLSGFAGRYLMSRIAQEIGDKRAMLARASSLYDATAQELQEHPDLRTEVAAARSFTVRFAARVLAYRSGVAVMPLAARAVGLAETIADLEYAIRTHDRFRAIFAWWLRFHIVISVALYALIAAHVWAELHFGLRWFR